MNDIACSSCGLTMEESKLLAELKTELTKAQELAKSRTIGHLYEQELEKNKRLEAELTRLREVNLDSAETIYLLEKKIEELREK